MTKHLSISRVLTLLLTAATHLIILMSMGNVWSDGLGRAAMYFAGFVVVGAWASGPYLLAHWRTAFNVDWPFVWVFSALSAVGAIFAFSIYYDAGFSGPPDAQAAIVYVVIPIYQYAVILVASSAVKWLRHRSG